jgi:ubiquinone/menaquinone biosynthesis C-methylase UbiE
MNRVWQSASVVATYLESVRGAVPLAAEQIDVMLRLIRRPVRVFLDVGCGDGILAAAILSCHPRARGVLLDFSEPMLAAARGRLRPHARRLRFLHADYGEVAWTQSVQSDSPFDVVVSGFSIHHQPDRRKRAIYRQIFDLLRPDGWFVNIEHVSSPSLEVESVWDDYMIDALHRQHPDQSRREVASRYHYLPDKAANILAPVEAQCRWLRRIGFADVDCYFKAFELAVFGGRRPTSSSRRSRGSSPSARKSGRRRWPAS